MRGTPDAIYYLILSFFNLTFFLLVIPNFKGKTRGKTARHLINSDKDSDIDDRRRMQRKIHQAQEIQREMSQLERQGEDLEANSREVEEALRSSDGCKANRRGEGRWLLFFFFFFFFF